MTTLTNDAGNPIASDEVSRTAGKYGPLLLEDYALLEKMAHFNRERIPERVVHALGAGARGEFTCTHDITHLTKARMFSEVGKTTPMFVRFSTVARSRGGGDLYRDLRGFAMKFYTEDGNWDLVSNNTPIFFVRDPMKFMDFIHSQKEHPQQFWRQDAMWWDFWSHVPESLHQVIWLMGDRGVPRGWRHVNGYGSHTFSLINEQGERTWVKFHFHSEQGTPYFTEEQWQSLEGKEPSWATKDLFIAIDEGRFPSWTAQIQTATDAQLAELPFNPFDLTKVWPHGDFPLQPFGRFELNANPENYFAEVEQAAFSPGNVPPGISFSPDRMLQSRIMSYADAHRHRLGVNYTQVPVNSPQRTEAHTPYRDGALRVDGNFGSRTNYHPTREPYPEATDRAKPPGLELHGLADRIELDEDDHYMQPRALILDVMSEQERARLVETIANSLGQCPQDTRSRQLNLFARVDEAFSHKVREKIATMKPGPYLEVKPGK